MSCVKTLTFEHGITAQICQDEEPENPIKTFDYEANVSIWHHHYDFGNHDEFKTPEVFEAHYLAQNHPAHLALVPEDQIIRLPVYLYDHSGLTVNTTGFSCPWDSGQVGWVWVTKAQAMEHWGCADSRILENLIGTVKLLNDYLTGDVYGYRVMDAEGAHLDSCWGFYGNVDECGVIEDATCSAEHYVEKAKDALAAHGLACQDALAKFRATQHKGLAI